MARLGRNENVIPDADKSKKFWSDICSVVKKYNRIAQWLNNITNDIGITNRENWR